MDDYLARIGAARPARADLAALRDLHRRHQETVPFENLDIHLGEPMRLDDDGLLDKIVRRRRGGICFELNGAFALLLRSLGFDVTILAARCFDGDALRPPFDHLALRVDVGGRSWLAEVGFGDHSVLPLDLACREPQSDPGGVFLLVDTADGDVDVLKDGEPQYRLELRPRDIADFEPAAWWHHTSAASPCTRSVTCSLPIGLDSRVTLKESRLISTVRGARSETALPDDDAILAAYRDHFGLVLDTAPHLRAEPAPL